MTSEPTFRTLDPHMRTEPRSFVDSENAEHQRKGSVL